MNDQSKLVHTILISGFVIIKKGEIVEARLQEDVLMMPKECASQVLFKTRIQDIQEIQEIRSR